MLVRSPLVGDKLLTVHSTDDEMKDCLVSSSLTHEFILLLLNWTDSVVWHQAMWWWPMGVKIWQAHARLLRAYVLPTRYNVLSSVTSEIVSALTRRSSALARLSALATAKYHDRHAPVTCQPPQYLSVLLFCTRLEIHRQEMIALMARNRAQFAVQRDSMHWLRNTWGETDRYLDLLNITISVA